MGETKFCWELYVRERAQSWFFALRKLEVWDKMKLWHSQRSVTPNKSHQSFRNGFETRMFLGISEGRRLVKTGVVLTSPGACSLHKWVDIVGTSALVCPDMEFHRPLLPFSRWCAHPGGTYTLPGSFQTLQHLSLLYSPSVSEEKERRRKAFYRQSWPEKESVEFLDGGIKEWKWKGKFSVCEKCQRNGDGLLVCKRLVFLSYSLDHLYHLHFHLFTCRTPDSCHSAFCWFKFCVVYFTLVCVNFDPEQSVNHYCLYFYCVYYVTHSGWKLKVNGSLKRMEFRENRIKVLVTKLNYLGSLITFIFIKRKIYILKKGFEITKGFHFPALGLK